MTLFLYSSIWLCLLMSIRLIEYCRQYIQLFPAFDYVGHSTSVTSDGVTIDTTAPRSDGASIDTGGSYVATEDALMVSWHRVFADAESGV